MKSEEEDKTPAEIEAEIAKTRDDLGDTVASVADKADVKKQAKKKTKEKVDEVKAQAAEIKETAAANLNDGSAGGGGFAESPLAHIAAAFVVGLAIGRITAR